MAWKLWTHFEETLYAQLNTFFCTMWFFNLAFKFAHRMNISVIRIVICCRFFHMNENHNSLLLEQHLEKYHWSWLHVDENEMKMRIRDVRLLWVLPWQNSNSSSSNSSIRKEVKRFNLLHFECERKFKYSSNAIMAHDIKHFHRICVITGARELDAYSV